MSKITFNNTFNKNFTVLRKWIEENKKWPIQRPPNRRLKNSKAIKLENTLGLWINSIRLRKIKQTLTRDIIDNMNSINFEWNGKKARYEIFNSKFFKDLWAYLKDNKILPDPHSSKSLSIVNGLKKRIPKYLDGNLKDNEMLILKLHKFDNWISDFNKKKTWDNWLDDLNDYYNVFKKMPSSHVSPNNSFYKLGIWVSANKCKLKTSQLSLYRKMKLQELGIDSQSNLNEIKWDKNLKLVSDFYAKNRVWPTQISSILKEKKLAMWLLNNKNWYNGNIKRNSSYPKERFNKLKKIGYNLEVKSRSNKRINWCEQFKYLEQYYKINKKFPTSKKQYPEYNNIGVWYNVQKSKIKHGKLSLEKSILINNLSAKCEKPFAIKHFSSEIKKINLHQSLFDTTVNTN
jgi:hypothetical protein